jgi:hypothetical protein
MPFKPGQSGNPLGRPKLDPDVVALARAASPDAIRKQIALLESEDENVALKAAQAILDRAYGKPMQNVTATVSTQKAEELADDVLASIALSGGEGTDQAEVYQGESSGVRH